jgi:hypothetical protein
MNQVVQDRLRPWGLRGAKDEVLLHCNPTSLAILSIHDNIRKETEHECNQQNRSQPALCALC